MIITASTITLHCCPWSGGYVRTKLFKLYGFHSVDGISSGSRGILSEVRSLETLASTFGQGNGWDSLNFCVLHWGTWVSVLLVFGIWWRCSTEIFRESDTAGSRCGWMRFCKKRKTSQPWIWSPINEKIPKSWRIYIDWMDSKRSIECVCGVNVNRTLIDHTDICRRVLRGPVRWRGNLVRIVIRSRLYKRSEQLT